MRKKIWKMSEGQFTHTVPETVLEPNEIIKTIVEGQAFDGSFNIICDKDHPTKGLVYTDNPYIYINTPAFDEENQTIYYRISANNLRAGDVIKGFFFIYSELCVKKLPFCITVEKSFPVSSVGVIKNIDDFAELARRSWKEAYILFYSDAFKEIMYSSPWEQKLIYRGFLQATKKDANLEEFLVATGRKSRVYYELDESPREFSYVNENRKETIDITRNTWGYIKLNVYSDGDFVTVENEEVTSDFFLGSKLSLNFYIHKDRLHAGKNKCKITVSGMGIVRTIEITASTGSLYERKNTDHIEKKRLIFELYKTYEDFRLKACDGRSWADNTIRLIDRILDYEEKDRLFYRLIRTHAVIVKGDRKMALDLIKSLRIDIVDKRSAEWAYLLYLGALLEPEEEYVDRLRREIELILDNHPEDIRIFWFLLFLRRDYLKNKSEKLRSIRHWINEGYDSPILYAEVYELYLEDTYLLNRFDDFTIKILSWAVKRGGINYNIAERVFDLLLKENGFNKKLYYILLKCYEIARNEVHLKSIISYMLKGGATGEEYSGMLYHGIEENIRLTGLFEAYIDSLPLTYANRLSPMALRYFSYNSNISSERKAFVYANVVLYKDSDPATYETYRPIIREFALEEMKNGKLDDNLAVLYQDIYNRNLMDSRMADALGNVIFSKKVICLSKNAKRCVVIEDQLREPVYSNFVNGVAFVPVYSKDSLICVESVDGSLSMDEKFFFVEDLYELGDSYETIRELATNKKPYFLRDFSNMESSGDLEDLYEEEALEYIFDKSIDESYLKNHFHIFMGFFKEHLREDCILSALLFEDRYRYYDNAILTYLANLLIIDGEYEKALLLFKDYVLLDGDKRQLLTALSVVVGDGTQSKGEFVLEMCIHLLRDGYHSEETIEYLVHHFIGLSQDMRLIFKYAEDSEALGAFCERFILQGLYSGTIESSDDNILICYLDKKPNPMIVEAYISYFAHLYLTENMTPPDSVFAILIRQLKVTDNVNDTCRFAFCKHLCEKDNLTRTESEILDILISDQITRNIYFPFYEDMDESFIIKYNLYDRMYISIKTDPGKDLVISITSMDEKQELDVNESYDGIYVKDLIVFFGDNITYSIYERNNPGEILLSGEYSYQDVSKDKKNRFLCINSMQEKLFFKDTGTLYNDIIDYENKINAAKEVFFSL